MKVRLNNTLIYNTLFVLGFVLIAHIPRADIYSLWAMNALLFGLWVLIFRKGFQQSAKLFFLIFLLIRLPFFFNLPLLSDDFYRFLWDGMLLNEGLNPLGRIPHDIIINNTSSPTFAQELLSGMNSAGYSSVYPPFHQFIFGVSYLFAGPNLLSGVNILRFFILVPEVAFLIFALTRRKRILPDVQAYLLNPLVVIEGLGNVHMEAALLPFLAVSLAHIEARVYLSGAMTWASAILIKLRPLILAPIIYASLPRNKRLGFFLLSGGMVLVFAIMFEPWRVLFMWSEGLGLYFGNFEFNASIYYLLREFISLFIGYNPVAVLSPLLAISAAGLIVFVAFKYRSNNLYENALIAYLIFLLLSPTVHPWYIIPVVYLAYASKRYLVLIWSFSVCFSYSHYMEPLSAKPFFLLSEYLLLTAGLYLEHKQRPWFQKALRG